MNRFIALLVLFGSLQPVLAQSSPESPTQSPASFRYLPERPKIDGTVSFTYTPTGALSGETAIQAVFLRYGSPAEMRSSQPETVLITQQNGVLVGQLKVPFKEVAGLLVAFQSRANPQLVDHNNGHFYPVPLYGKTGKMLPHATGGQASVMMRTSFPYLLKVKPDWAWVIGQYEREIEQYPTIRPAYWADLIRAKIQQASTSPAGPANQPAFVAEINAYLASQQPTPTPADLMAAAQLYELLKEPQLVKAARDQIKAVDPNRDEAQKARAEAILAEPDAGRRRAAFDAFVLATPKSRYRELVVSAVADGYFKADKLKEAVLFLAAEAAPATDPSLLLNFARELTGEGRGLPQAEWFARRAVWAFQKRPVPAASGSAAGSRAAQIRTAQATLASAVDQQGLYSPALTHYREAGTGILPKLTDPRTNERTWFCAVKAARPDSVWPFMEQVVLAGRTTPKLRSDLRDWLTPRLTDEPARKVSYQRTLALLDRTERRATLATTFIDEPAPAFVLKTLNGKTVSLASLRGKIAVLNFWATGCEPCLGSFSSLRQTRDQVKKDPGIQFLFVNTRDNSPARQVRSFVSRQPLLGVVPLDPTQAMSATYGVQRVPTTVIVDANGRIRYRSPDNANAEEIALAIEALRH